MASSTTPGTRHAPVDRPVAPVVAGHARVRAPGRTVIVAHHDPVVRAGISARLEGSGYRVVAAERGEKCLFLAMDRAFDAFVVELGIGGLPGLEVCRRLRQLAPYRHSPIVCVLPADADRATLGEVFDAGADDFVTDTDDTASLEARLTGHLVKCARLEEGERVRQNLNRYISRRTKTMVEAYSITGELPGPEAREMCIMFSDVRGFTALSRALPPETLFETLSRHLGMQVEAVYRHGGYVDKFAGDGIMAVFDNDGRVESAGHCALEILALSERQNPVFEGVNLALGIGLHAGAALVGNIGSEAHLDYSVVGEAVNLAARLCGCADPMSIVVSDAVASVLADDPRFRLGLPDRVRIRGLAEPTVVYSLRPGETRAGS